MKRSIDHLADAHPSPTTKKIKLWSAADYLVADTLRIIFSKLDPKNIRKARLVCKQWFEIVDIPEFNIGALRRDELPLVIETLGRYNKPISIRFKNLPHVNPEHLLQLKILDKLVELSGDIDFQKHEALLSSLTGLQSLTTTQLPSSAFSILTRLTKLTCKGLIGEIIGPVTQLEELEIEDENFNDSFNKFPNLKQLKAYTFKVECQLTKLESLVLEESSSCDGFPTSLTCLVMKKFSFDKDARINCYQVLTNLTRLKDLNPFVPIKDILQHFPMLERADVGVIKSDDTAAWSAIGRIPRLTSLTVLLSKRPSDDCFSRLTNLRLLNIFVKDDVDKLNMSVFSSLVHLTLLKFMGSFAASAKNFYSLTSLTDLQHLETHYYVSETFANNMTSLTSLKISILQELYSNKKHCFTNLTNLVELHLVMREKVNKYVEGLDKMTHLTHLMLDSEVTDDEWNQIIKLTGLLYYGEYRYMGKNVERLADLTAVQKLTDLKIGDYFEPSNLHHLTSMTRLQRIGSEQSFFGHRGSQIYNHLPLLSVPKEDDESW